MPPDTQEVSEDKKIPFCTVGQGRTDSILAFTFGDTDRTLVEMDLNDLSEEVLALQRKELMQYNLLNSKMYSATNNQGKRVLVSSRLVITPQASNP